jgi:hypothetical protein
MKNPRLWGDILLKVVAPATVALGGILITLKNDSDQDNTEILK